ncbi:MAG: PmoA family protein, partial [Planctomycetaceae bacterium]|nr:PmoA family protein [Planctomycetaceae bacterium]
MLAPAVHAADRVGFQSQDDGTLQIKVGDRVFAVLNSADQWAKPFLYPMYSPEGKNILRPIIPTAADQGSSKDGTDHFHHKGVWIAVDSVNDEKLNFWHEKDRIDNQSVSCETAENGTGIITLENNWMEGDAVLLKEKTVVTIHPTGLTTWQIQLQAVEKDVTFHDTKEGFFAVRVAHSMREMNGGRIEN